LISVGSETNSKGRKPPAQRPLPASMPVACLRNERKIPLPVPGPAQQIRCAGFYHCGVSCSFQKILVEAHFKGGIL